VDGEVSSGRKHLILLTQQIAEETIREMLLWIYSPVMIEEENSKQAIGKSITSHKILHIVEDIVEDSRCLACLWIDAMRLKDVPICLRFWRLCPIRITTESCPSEDTYCALHEFLSEQRSERCSRCQDEIQKL
jgi:hypothetical protein